MTFVVPFRNYRPSGRNDAIKWVFAHAQEALDVAGEPGAFTTIESFAIADYPDPTTPPYVNVTTDQATQRPGWYRLRFADSGAGEEFSAPRFWGAEGYRPSTRDVAFYIKNRTVDDNNVYVGDFGLTGAVTKDDVEGLITKAEQRVLRKLDTDPNTPIPTESHFFISDAIALYAAMLVELTKYSEQVQTNRSPYPYLKILFDEMMNILLKDILDIDPPVQARAPQHTVWDLVLNGSGEASFAFPNPDTVNWDTSF